MQSFAQPLLELGHSPRHARKKVSFMLQVSWNMGNLQIVKGKLARCAAKLVDKATRQVAAKDGTQVRVGDTLNDGVEPNLLNQEIGEGIGEDRRADTLILPQLR